MALLDHQEAGVRSEALGLIARLADNGIHDRASLPKVISLLDSRLTEWNASSALIRLALKGIYDTACLPGTLALLNNEREGVRLNAEKMVGILAKHSICDSASIPMLLSRLGGDEAERYAASNALDLLASAGVGDMDCLRAAIPLLKDESARVRTEAAAWIGNLAIMGVMDAAAMPELLLATSDGDGDVREWALYATKAMMGKGAEEPSVNEIAFRMLEDPDKDVRFRAAELVAFLTEGKE
jgi:HEAT repeat protein